MQFQKTLHIESMKYCLEKALSEIADKVKSMDLTELENFIIDKESIWKKLCVYPESYNANEKESRFITISMKVTSGLENERKECTSKSTK